MKFVKVLQYEISGVFVNINRKFSYQDFDLCDKINRNQYQSIFGDILRPFKKKNCYHYCFGNIAPKQATVIPSSYYE